MHLRQCDLLKGVNSGTYLTHNTNSNTWYLVFAAYITTLQWRHNERDGVSNHQPHYCILNRLFRRKSKKTSKLRVTGLCAGNSPVTGEFPAQRASNAENVSIWWRYHEIHLISSSLQIAELSVTAKLYHDNHNVSVIVNRAMKFFPCTQTTGFPAQKASNAELNMMNI